MASSSKKNLLGKRKPEDDGYGFAEFASSNQAKKVLETKNDEYLLDRKVFLHVAKTKIAPRPKYNNLVEKLCYEDYIRREDEATKVVDETPNEAVAVRKNTVFVGLLSPQTNISDIIDFFKDVGQVVHVRLIVSNKDKHEGYGFVEFASANQAKKALEKKNGEYLHDREIFLNKAYKIATPGKSCIDHKVWYEDYLRQESRLVYEDEAVEGLDVIPDLVEEVVVSKKTLFAYNYKTNKPKISDLINLFESVGEVVLRLTVNHRGEALGCGFLEFTSANEAKKVLQKKNGEICTRKVLLDVVKTLPYLLRPKYNLAEKLWYEENLIEEDDLEVPNIYRLCGKNITFSDEDDDGNLIEEDALWCI
ncbi:hypothetical protein AALP_AA1G044600 [Arabis alpina]|uniref:RRM domain-containing protein n=1 Tax=Arabis alpina TaxID=50452 RepID=A0A087HL25_ARAAL|nr:hypothetical protein AALP_AA1G044600 [Arabis alpina]